MTSTSDAKPIRWQEAPHRPGVYVMRDRFGRIIYVGKARDLRKRLSSYFLPSRRGKADRKTRALLDSVRSLEWHEVKSDAEAVLYEGKLIKEFRPKYNISFRDDKRFLLVKVQMTEPFPRFQLTRLRKEDGARYFGPFAHSGALRSALNTMRRLYGLRSCRPSVPGEKDHRHCLDHIIKNCSAPCIQRIDREGYIERVNQACEFLEGRSKEMIEAVEKEMRDAAERLDFEKAAQLRNLLEDLQKTAKPMTRFTRKSLPSALDPQKDLESLGEALGLPGPPEIMECFDISNITTTHVVASMVRFVQGQPDRASYRKYRIRSVKGQNDFASMAEVVRRRYSRILREGKRLDPYMDQDNVLDAAGRAGVNLPHLIVVDGGKGQLSFACGELQRLGLYDIPIIGLAKEFEEIHRPGRALPLRLSADSGALKLLQRIRDEAHRFANSYHSLLLKKRMRESLLDEIPGVSEARKKALLAKFGSIEKIRKAQVEVLAETPGISSSVAEEVHRYFHSKIEGNRSR